MQIAKPSPDGVRVAARSSAGAVAMPWLQATPLAARPTPVPRQFHIHGVTHEGRLFRPSDWAERLAGAMSSFRPGARRGGVATIGAFIGYSPWCVPQVVNEVRCVLVSEALREIEPMAWDFVMSFARDNSLPVRELAPEPAGATPVRVAEEAQLA